MKRFAAIALVLILGASFPLEARNLPVKIGKTAFVFLRNSDEPEKLPALRIENSGEEAAEFAAVTTLTRPDGSVAERFEAVFPVAPGESATVDLFGGKRREVKGEILLLHTKLQAKDGEKGEISGIYGTPAPVERGKAGLVGMNVHLSRYRASTRWKLLQMMKEAGVTTVRVDSVFPSPLKPEARRDAVDKLRDDILALEAFGLHSLVCIAYFNEPFFLSPVKQEMAYEWAKILAASVKGRTGFHFGNETNSGWGGYGAAADMAALHGAFGLGVAAADPGAERGSFGIAEGPTSYVRKFCETGAMDELDAIAIHPYCGTPEAGIAKSVEAKNAMRSLGLERQVWATEVGFHVDRGEGWFNVLTGELTGVTGFSLDMQRRLLPRLYLLAASCGIDRVYWYDFFGRGDPETFWIVAPDFTPRPAYRALKVVSSFLKGLVPVDRTGFDLVVQRHLFRRPDGSMLMACWAQGTGVDADFKLPPHARISDDFGEPVTLPADGILKLGHGVFYVENLTAAELPRIINHDVLLSGLDARTFKEPTQRFHVVPGESFEIPVVAFNGSGKPVRVAPFAVNGIPGWEPEFPEAFFVAPARNATAAIRVKVPANAVPGVEYCLTVQARLDDLQLSHPYSVRIKTTGSFPWRGIENFRKAAEYPQWSSMEEPRMPIGNPLLEAEKGEAIVDGDLGEWKAEEFYPIDQKFAGALRDPQEVSELDWSGKVAFRWTDSHIYAAFLIRDDQLCFPDFLSRDWRDSDNVRLMLSSIADPQKRSQAISANDLLLVMTPTGFGCFGGPRVNVSTIGGFVRRGIEKEIRMASKVWRNGYVLEVAIPTKIFNLVPESGKTIGLGVLADDADANHRQTVALTRAENLHYWRSPKSAGCLKLK